MNQVIFAGTDAIPSPDQLNRIGEPAVDMFFVT
jgi:hypothetical protein